MSIDCDFSFTCLTGVAFRSKGAEDRLTVSVRVASSAADDGVTVAISVPARELGVDGGRLQFSTRVFRGAAIVLCRVAIWMAVEFARIEGWRRVGGERRQ